MSTDLNLRDDNPGSLVAYVENPYQEDLSTIAGSGFLPYIKLCSGKTKEVNENKINMNHFGLIRSQDEIQDLGKEVDLLLLTYRSRAMDNSNGFKTTYDLRSEMFQDIKYRADNVQNSNCTYGPEFLVWCPDKSCFATMYLGSASGRNESRKIISLYLEGNRFIGGPVTFKSKTIKNDAGQFWQSPFAVKCSSPFDCPSKEDQLPVIQAFLNPPKQEEPEKVQAEVRVDR